MSFKNIRIPKRGGGSRLQRVQVLESGKYKFVKNPKKSRSQARARVTRKSKRKRGGSMAKRKSSRRRQFKIPLAATAGLAGPLIMKVAAPAFAGDWMYAGRELTRIYTGYDPQDGSWDIGRLQFGLLPALGGAVASMIASKLGLNRYFARVPFVKI